MPGLKKDVEKALSKKGFTLETKRDHNYYFLYLDNKKTPVNTKVSHGSNKDISDSLLALIRREMHLPKKEFDDYMNCTFSKKQYLDYLKNNGYI